MSKFLFTSNGLSKKNAIISIFRILAFQSNLSLKKSISLISKFFQIEPSSIFLFGAGRMSVYTILSILDRDNRDEVIVAGYTCVVLTNAVKFANYKVKYVDVDFETLNMSKEALLRSITSKTRAVIIPHNFGIPFEGIKEIKQKHPDLIIIEDVAHSFGSMDSEGNLCGRLGDFAFFSFEYSKPISAGLGGLLLVNNISYLDKIQNEYSKLEKTPFRFSFKMTITLLTYSLSYSRFTSLIMRANIKLLRLFNWVYATSKKEIEGTKPENYPVKLNPIQSNMLFLQLKNIDRINQQKQQIQNLYFEYLKGIPSLQLPIPDDKVVMVRYPIVVKPNIEKDRIESFKKNALASGYNFGVWFNDVVHPKGSFRYCYKEGDCPNGEMLSSHILNLPININCKLNESEFISLRDLFNGL